GGPRELPSFPTRRSSDLLGWRRRLGLGAAGQRQGRRSSERLEQAAAVPIERLVGDLGGGNPQGVAQGHGHLREAGGFGWTILARSEEHTSELQSRENLVC